MLNELLNSPAVPVFTFLLGLVVGHWLTIDRDKRKEYNELVTPLRKKITAEASDPLPSVFAIDRHDADAICARRNIVSNIYFMKACKRYWQAKECCQQDDLGQPFHPNKDAIRKAANNLLDKIPIR